MANNNILFNSAFAGAISAISSRWITSLTGAQYQNQILAAQAYATKVDELIGAGVYAEKEARLLESISHAFWNDRDPKFTSASDYLAAAGPVVTLWSQGLSTLLPEPGGSVSGLTNVLYVDPGNGEAYQTIQAAIDAGAASALSGGCMIVVRPFSTFVENLTFPAGVWELACWSLGSNTSSSGGIPNTGSLLTGNVTFTGASQSALKITNFRVTGNATITIPAAVGATFRLENSHWIGNITNSGPGFCNFFARGWADQNFQEHQITGTVDMSPGGGGWFYCFGYVLRGDVSGFRPEFQNCVLANNVDVTNTDTAVSGNNQVRFFNCSFSAANIVTGSANGFVNMDSQSAASFIDGGNSVVGSLFTVIDADRSVDVTINANQALANFFGGAPPAGQYEASCNAVVVTAGVSGTAQVNISYTDELGASGSVPLLGAGLSVAGTGRTGSNVGSRIFRVDGSTNIQWSVTGITDGTGLSLRINLTIRRIS